MKSMHQIQLPDNAQIEGALRDLFVRRGNNPLSASDVYRLLAEKFDLDFKQLNAQCNKSHDKQWHMRCRSARNNLVKTGAMKREPWNTWCLTESAYAAWKSLEEFFDAHRT